MCHENGSSLPLDLQLCWLRVLNETFLALEKCVYGAPDTRPETVEVRTWSAPRDTEVRTLPAPGPRRKAARRGNRVNWRATIPGPVRVNDWPIHRCQRPRFHLRMDQTWRFPERCVPATGLKLQHQTNKAWQAIDFHYFCSVDLNRKRPYSKVPISLTPVKLHGGQATAGSGTKDRPVDRPV